MDNGTSPVIQQFPGDRQQSEVRTSTDCSPKVVAVREPSLPDEGDPIQRRGTAAVQDDAGEGTSGVSSYGSGSDADTDEGDHSVSVASLEDLVAAYDNALVALQPGDEQGRDTFVWINKCQLTIGSMSAELSKFATGVLASCCVGNADLQSIVRRGGDSQLGDSYEQRFQAVEEYIIAAEDYFVVQKNERMDLLEAESEESDETEEIDVPSDTMAVGSSIDSMEGIVLNRSSSDNSGEVKAKGSEEIGKTEMADESEARRRRLSSISGGCARKILKTDRLVEERSAAKGVVNPVATQQEVMPEDVTNSRGGDERQSLTTGGAEKSGDHTSTNSTGNNGDAVEEGQQKPTADSSSSEPEQMRRVEDNKRLAAEDACKRAQVVRKLVTRQGEALSRMNARAESRMFRMFRESHSLLTSVKCAGYVCNSALDAHRMAHIALQIAVSSHMPGVVDTLRGAAHMASQYADMAIGSCETAVQLHKDAVRILEGAMAPLFAVQDDRLLGQSTVREVNSAAEEIRQFVEKANFSPVQLENKLSEMELKIRTLSRAFIRAKDVNLMTKHMAKKFDDATFQIRIVSAVFGTTFFVLKAMTAATNALGSLQ